MSKLSKLLHSYKNLVWFGSKKTWTIKNTSTTLLRSLKSLPPLKRSTKLALALAGGTVLPFFLPTTTQESPEKYEHTTTWKDSVFVMPFKPIITASQYPAIVALVAANIIVSRGVLRSLRLLPISNLLFCISPSHVKMGLKACFIGYSFAHLHFGQLFLNMYLLCAFGPEVIDKYGNVPFLILYFGGALAGSLVSTLNSFRADLMMNKIFGATGAVFSVMSAYCWTRTESFLWIPTWVWFPFPVLLFEFLLVKTKQINATWDLHVASCLFGITAAQCLQTPSRYQFTGKGEITLNGDGDKYEGEITNGMPTGKGKITSKYYPPYEGDVVNGIRKGIGKISYDSCTYEGEVNQNRRHGNGILYNSLFKLTGFWKRDELKKYTEIEIEHAIIKGEFYKGASENYYGSGTFALKDGHFTYEGEMKNMMFHGKGVSESTKSETKIIKKGNFEEGKLANGTVTYQFPNGEIREKTVKNFEIVAEKEVIPTEKKERKVETAEIQEAKEEQKEEKSGGLLEDMVEKIDKEEGILVPSG
eukprot:Phypoly_transcript_06652.p1 GENE.Phypoly_transcript_06652~~Phypoly_transcript_06652.p1  ORF type:complete len:531 (-),score=81.11 Phypoly_transcript_06652:8-1600(-)